MIVTVIFSSINHAVVSVKLAGQREVWSVVNGIQRMGDIQIINIIVKPVIIYGGLRGQTPNKVHPTDPSVTVIGGSDGRPTNK
jgi:hypothetical protein